MIEISFSLKNGFKSPFYIYGLDQKGLLIVVIMKVGFLFIISFSFNGEITLESGKKMLEMD